MSDRIAQVLVATALDEASDEVVSTGVEIARVLGARALLVHAFEPPFAFGTELGPALGNEQYVQLEAERVREALAGQALRHGLGDAWKLLAGSPGRALVEAVAEHQAGLLIAGATAAGGMARLLGSTADRVIRRSPVPVLVLRGHLPVPPARVLYPVDLSALSAEALRRGWALVAALGAAPQRPADGGAGGDGCCGGRGEALFVLSVLQRQVAPQFTPEQVDRFAAGELERFVAACGGGLRCRVRTGNPREEILAEVASYRPDLLVLGTHGRGGFDRLVIGSVAADVVRQAPVSVLVVPPRAAAGTTSEDP